MEEMNVKTVTPCNDPLMYASLRAEPNFRYVYFNVRIMDLFLSIAECFWYFHSVLGKRLGKYMGKVSSEVKKMSHEQIFAFEKSGEISFCGHCLKLDDIKVIFHMCAF
jgi:isoleucyl-tRNA synthetase